MKELKIVGLAGSLRQHSYNRSALRAAQMLAPADVDFSIIDLSGLPLFNEDDEKAPLSSVLEFREKIRAADAVLISTPEYNYSFSGVLKNAIDWASRPYGQGALLGKPVAVMGASISLLGTARAQYQLRQIFVALNMPVLQQPEVMIAQADKLFDDQGRLTDDKTGERIKALVVALAAWTRQIKSGAA